MYGSHSIKIPAFYKNFKFFYIYLKHSFEFLLCTVDFSNGFGLGLYILLLFSLFSLFYYIKN